MPQVGWLRACHLHLPYGQELVAQQREDAVLAVHPGARGKPRIALIMASGTIVQGPVKPGAAPAAQKLIDATGLAAELEKLEKDPMVGDWGAGSRRRRGLALY